VRLITTAAATGLHAVDLPAGFAVKLDLLDITGNVQIANRDAYKSYRMLPNLRRHTAITPSLSVR